MALAGKLLTPGAESAKPSSVLPRQRLQAIRFALVFTVIQQYFLGTFCVSEIVLDVVKTADN